MKKIKVIKNKMASKEKFFLTYAICFILLLGVLIVTTNFSKAKENESLSSVLEEVVGSNDLLWASNVAKTSDSIYLSDIDYIANQTSTKWDKIRYDEVNGGGKITVKIENNTFTFDKGIWAHATSQVTYDISAYDYKYFTAFIGLNTTTSKGNGVKFTISTSKDGSTWTPQVQDLLKQPGENATFIKVDVSDAKYLRLYANDNGSNGNDHSVYADAKLTNETSASSNFLTVEEYDKIIKEKYGNQTDISGEFEFTLLKRELIKNVGQYSLATFYNASAENKAVIDWLMNNQDALRYYILGGAPTGGSYYNSLGVLSRLYYNYKEDFNNPKILNNKWEPSVTAGEVYLKLAVSISLTHAKTVGLWMWSSPKENQSDPVRRYAIYKYLYDNDGFKANDKNDMTSWFEALKVEEMRFVVQNMIDDEEILWLNNYVKTRIAANNGNVGNLLTPHPYMAYVWPNYTNDLFFTNDAYFNELFAVNKTSNNVGKELVAENGTSTGKVGLWDSEFVIPGNKEVSEYRIKISKGNTSYKLTKLWMNFRNKFGTGAVCGGISKSGSNIRNVFAIPAAVIGQPGHAALLYYSKLADGRGTWGIDNDVSGWTLSEKGERLLLGWGNGSYAKGFYQVVYMQLGQEAINDFDNLVKAEELVKLASVYSGNLTKQEEIYRKALRAQSFNLDAWLGLIDVYNKSTAKTEDDYYKLAEEIATNLKNFPLPMYNLTNLIKPKLNSIINSYKFTLLQTRTLTEASNLQSSEDVVSPSLTRKEANYLLGKMDKTIATFSFDGEDAGKIVLASRFDGSGIRWDYSLDGKKTWNEVSFTAEESHKLQLTKEQIASITAENDIYVHIVGVNYNEENLYKIDITEGILPKYDGGDYLYGNDLENRVVGVDLTMEWRMSENEPWTSYAKSSPDLTGNKTVQVRVGATGTKLPSPFATFTFTEDNQPNNRKYIPVSSLSIHQVSSEATSNHGNATYSIDGNYNTRWHSAWNGSDTNRFIIVKLDQPMYLTAVEFVPAGGGNGKIVNGTIYGSTDGESWTELTKQTGLTYNPSNVSTAELAKANTKSFDIAEPQLVQYVKIVADQTNGNWFTARAFNFYQDASKNPNPTAGIGYSTTEATNKDVVVRLVNPSTTIKITNNSGLDTYTFTENGEFTFEFIDEESGLTGSATAKVNWIDKIVPTATIEYSTKNPTNLEVNAKLIPSENVTIITNENDEEEGIKDPDADPFTITFNENGEYTFYFKDEAGNIGSATAKVTWIDKESPRATILYSTTNKTDENVIATLTNASENIIITNNGGKNTYTFTENGEYTFYFKDAAGNIGSAKAVVTWIVKEENNNNSNNPVPDDQKDPANDQHNNQNNNGTGDTNNSSNNNGTNNASNNNSVNNGGNNSSNANAVIKNPSGSNNNNNNTNDTINDNNTNDTFGDNNTNNGNTTAPIVDNKESETTTTNKSTKKESKNDNTWKIIIVLILIILVIIISEIHIEKPKKEIPISF